MKNSLIVILNPKSGSSGDDFRAQIESELQNRGAQFELQETTLEVGADVLAQKAAEAGAAQILICGGDGTVMSAVNGLGQIEGAATTLSIVPGGTANLLAQALEIPHDVPKAVEIALEGQDKHIDLGRCGEHLFALGLGLGLTERLVSQASTKDKEKWGRWAYVKAMLSELGAPPHTFSFSLDDGKLNKSKGVAIVVANSGDIGGKLKFAPDALMDDGLLDLCVLHRFYLRDIVRMIGLSLVGKMAQDRAVSFFQSKRIEIKSDPPLDLQIDGEMVEMQTPLVVEVKPTALKVRVPSDDQKTTWLEKVVESPEKAVETVSEAVQKSPQWIALGVALSVVLVAAIWKARKRK